MECRACSVELADESKYCHLCGTAQERYTSTIIRKSERGALERRKTTTHIRHVYPEEIVVLAQAALHGGDAGGSAFCEQDDIDALFDD